MSPETKRTACVCLDGYYIERDGAKTLISTQNCLRHRSRKPGEVPA